MTSTTLSEEVATALIKEIVSGKLSAGTRLNEPALAKRFKVSRTPVRDALRILAASRLVEFTPRRGFSVMPIDRAKLQDAYEAFSEIEALCARLCALRAGVTEREQLILIHEGAKAAAENGDAQRYTHINSAFHDVIYAGTHNKTLEKIALDLRQQLRPYWSRVFFEMQNSQAEHQTLLDAILSKDAEAAAAAMTRHTSRLALHVLHQIATGASAMSLSFSDFVSSSPRSGKPEPTLRRGKRNGKMHGRHRK